MTLMRFDTFRDVDRALAQSLPLTDGVHVLKIPHGDDRLVLSRRDRPVIRCSGEPVIWP
jgi:hypothetical protein